MPLRPIEAILAGSQLEVILGDTQINISLRAARSCGTNWGAFSLVDYRCVNKDNTRANFPTRAITLERSELMICRFMDILFQLLAVSFPAERADVELKSI